MKPLLLVLLAFSYAHANAADSPKRVVVCTYTAGFRHSSIPQGERAIQEISEQTKAFEIVSWVRQVNYPVPAKPEPPKPLPTDADEKQREKHAQQTKSYEEALAQWTPEVEANAAVAAAEKQRLIAKEMEPLLPENLRKKKIDGVIFVNTSGDIPIPDVPGFVQWIEAGGAFAGMHAASDTLKNSAPFMNMLQGCFNGHGPQVPAELTAADPSHPVNGEIGDSWKIAQEEIYLISKQDRQKTRSMWFLRHHPNKPTEAGFFPISWVRKAGEGRVFYTALGHREDLWDTDPNLPKRINSVETAQQFRNHITGGILWALGVKPGSSEPNPEVN